MVTCEIKIFLLHYIIKIGYLLLSKVRSLPATRPRVQKRSGSLIGLWILLHAAEISLGRQFRRQILAISLRGNISNVHV